MVRSSFSPPEPVPVFFNPLINQTARVSGEKQTQDESGQQEAFWAKFTFLTLSYQEGSGA